MELSRAAHTLLQHLDRVGDVRNPDQSFDRDRLLAVAADPGTPEDLFAATTHLLQRPDEWRQLETSAGIGPEDGMAGRLDLVAAASRRLDTASAAALLLQHPEIDTMAGLGSADGRFGTADLQAALHQGSPDLAEAAWFFASQPSEFRYLENAAGAGMRDDGFVGAQDLVRAVNAYRYQL